MKIYTRVNVDLDAVSSVWAVKRMIPEAKHATVEFHPPFWDGSGMKDDDIAVGLSAGGRGIQAVKEDGTVHSSFARIVAKYATPSDREVLEPLIRYVDAQMTHHSAVKFLVPEMSSDAQQTLEATGLCTVLRALQIQFRDDGLVVKRMSDILFGMLRSSYCLKYARREATHATVLKGKVAIAKNFRQFGTNDILFKERGIRVIVYADGNNLGLIKNHEVNVRMDHPELRKVVAKQGEAKEWFAHPAGNLYCRGTRKSPVETMSKVNPYDLANTVLRLL